jgi:translation initiation factor IF-3
MLLLSSSSYSTDTLHIDEALRTAQEKGLDLVLVDAATDPPYCKFLDAAKYQYEKEKDQKENQRQSTLQKRKSNDIKLIKMKYGIGQGDIQSRIEHAKKFLEEGCRVCSCTLVFSHVSFLITIFFVFFFFFFVD